jgi:multiple sugar transport system substrate-binding protein
MFRKLTATALLTVMGISLLSQPAKAADTTSISFYAFGDAAEGKAYQSLVDAFTAKHPEIKVNFVMTQGEDEFKFGDNEDAYRQRLSLDFGAGKPPDVFLFNYREYGQFAEKDALEPVGPYLDKSTTIKASDFYPQAIKPFTDKEDGKTLLCLPQNASPAVIYYNKDLFDTAKLSYPAADWTWDDFVKDAQSLTKNTDDPKKAQYGLSVEIDFARVVPFIWSNGGDLVDSYDKPTKFTIDTPESKAAFQAFIDLQNKYHVVPDEEAAQSLSIEDRFLQGTSGMLMFSRRITPSLRGAKFNWDVAPLPKFKQPATLLYSDGYCMSKAGKNKDAAWTFIEFANTVEGQTLLAKTGRTVPSRQDVASSPAFLDPTVKPANSKLFIDQLAVARTVPIMQSWADIEEGVNQQLESAYYGEQGVDDLVKKAIDDTKSQFSGQ